MSGAAPQAPEGHPICPICQEDLEAAESNGVPRGVFLPCNHPFHAQCLFTLASGFWRDGAAATCPLCRAHMVAVHLEDEERDITLPCVIQ
jgi:uncharacterized Zn finger protein (UPF0148 family)